MQLLADRGPLVLALEQCLPIRLCFLPGNQFPQRRDIEYHTVVEIGIEIEVGRAFERIVEVLQASEARFEKEARLRKKLEAGDRSRLIQTVRGIGYVLREE